MKAYGWVVLIMAACTAVGTLILPLLSVTDVAMLFLLAVGLVASRFGRGPSMVAAFLSIALFDFFFVPPRFTFAVADLHYVLTFGVMLVTALAISTVASRLREHADAALARERRTATLYAMSHELLTATSEGVLADVIARHGREAFSAQVQILLRDAGGQMSPPAGATAGFALDQHAQATAQWSFDLWQAAGIGTANFPDVPLLFLPLVGAGGRLGVLAVRPDDPTPFRKPAVRQVLETFAGQAAVAVERVRAMRAEAAESTTSG
jgi:two-component system, OmpR family, sensor histidine kinase KdpD